MAACARVILLLNRLRSDKINALPIWLQPRIESSQMALAGVIYFRVANNIWKLLISRQRSLERDMKLLGLSLTMK